MLSRNNTELTFFLQTQSLHYDLQEGRIQGF